MLLPMILETQWLKKKIPKFKMGVEEGRGWETEEKGKKGMDLC